MDRTEEFRTLAAGAMARHASGSQSGSRGVLSSSSRGRGSNATHTPSQKPTDDSVLLTRAASSIMQQVSECSGKLKRLTRLVKSADSTAVFSDPRKEIQVCQRAARSSFLTSTATGSPSIPPSQPLSTPPSSVWCLVIVHGTARPGAYELYPGRSERTQPANRQTRVIA